MQNKSISDQGFINFLSNRIQARLFPLTSPNGDLNSRTKLPSAKSPVPMAATSSGWRRQASRLVGGPPDIHLGSQDDQSIQNSQHITFTLASELRQSIQNKQHIFTK